MFPNAGVNINLLSAYVNINPYFTVYKIAAACAAHAELAVSASKRPSTSSGPRK